jgi:YfiH family protein
MSELDLIRCDLLDPHSVNHGFTTRLGGVSKGEYSSLNITRSRGDDAADVAENRRRLRLRLGLDHLVFATQVHGCNVIQVDGSPKGDQSAGDGDALITNQPGIGLVCQTADCTPILIFDPVGKAIAAIHSGWRSTVLDIVGQTIRALDLAYGSKPTDLIAAIGPSISPKNYRVGPEVVAQFERLFTDDDRILSVRDEAGGAQLDVAAACETQLIKHGLQVSNIWRSQLCTYAEPDRLFSARRSHHNAKTGIFGGQCGVIGLNGASGSSSP